MEIVLIKIEDGEMFEGTLEMFRDCFFSNADQYTIQEWADEHGYKVEFFFE